MKLKDVKVGMRVAVLNDEGEVYGFGEVREINGIDIHVDGRWCNAPYLRKAKPKRSVTLTAKIRELKSPIDHSWGTLDLAHIELAPLIGKTVRVTVREIK